MSSFIGYDRRSPTWTLVGTGADWVGDGTPDKLNDGRPQACARLQWLSDGSPATSQYVELQGSLSGLPQVPRVAMLMAPVNTNVTPLPTGVKLELRGRLASGGGYTASLGGNSLNQRTVAMPGSRRGVVAMWVLDDGLGEMNGYSLRIYNDRNGSTWATSSTITDLGELVIQPAAEVCVKPGYSWGWVDPTITRRSLTSQLDVVQRVPYRTLDLGLAAATEAVVEQDGVDWLTLQSFLLSGGDSLCFLRDSDQDGVFSSTVLHANGAFGSWREVGGREHVSNSVRRYATGMKFEEIPQ